tara:strand:- start:84 stop:410 length:327 start_codon:yes stop_codon:yes gene_type:complete
MDIKIGCDIVEIKRFNDIDNGALRKIFHEKEIKNNKPETLAGMFAAKESCKKVFNELGWHDMEISKEKNGKPKVMLNVERSILSQDVSISHDGGYAIAYAVFLLEDEN